MEIIEALNDQGQTIILITHETYTAEYSERIIKVRDGQIESEKKFLNAATPMKTILLNEICYKTFKKTHLD